MRYHGSHIQQFPLRQIRKFFGREPILPEMARLPAADKTSPERRTIMNSKTTSKNVPATGLKIKTQVKAGNGGKSKGL
jgi:hypothetical protein